MAVHHPALRDVKRTEEIKLRLTQREQHDIAMAAADEDRAFTEYVVRVLRLHLYGSVARRQERQQRAAQAGAGAIQGSVRAAVGTESDA